MQPIPDYPAVEPAGLFDAIQAAGHSVWTHDGVRHASNADAVRAIIAGYTLDAEKARVQAHITQLAKLKFDAAIAGISAGEMAGWPILKSEAEAYTLSLNVADCPSIETEAAARGISVSALAAKVLANADRFNGLRAAISGVSGRHRDAVSALASFEAVAAYDYHQGWPL